MPFYGNTGSENINDAWGSDVNGSWVAQDPEVPQSSRGVGGTLRTAAQVYGGLHAAKALIGGVAGNQTVGQTLGAVAQDALGAFGGSPVPVQLAQKAVRALVAKNGGGNQVAKVAVKSACASGACRTVASAANECSRGSDGISPAQVARNAKDRSDAEALKAAQAAKFKAQQARASSQQSARSLLNSAKTGVQFNDPPVPRPIPGPRPRPIPGPRPVPVPDPRQETRSYSAQGRKAAVAYGQTGVNKAPVTYSKAAVAGGYGSAARSQQYAQYSQGPRAQQYAQYAVQAPQPVGSSCGARAQAARAAQSAQGSSCGIVKPIQPSYSAEPGSCGLNQNRCAQSVWNEREIANQTFHTAAYGVPGISAINDYNPSCIQEAGLCTSANAWAPPMFNYQEPPTNNSCAGQSSYANCLTDSQLQYNPTSYAALH